MQACRYCTFLREYARYSSTLPSGLSEMGLPLGLQLVAAFGEDEVLLTGAALIDKMTGAIIS